MVLKPDIPKLVRINEAWEVGFNQIVDFAPFVEGTLESVRVLLFVIDVVPVSYRCGTGVTKRF